MNYSRLLSSVAVATLLLPGAVHSQTVKAAGKTNEPKIVGPGLSLLRYALHPSQAAADKSSGYVHYASFTKPLRAPKTLSGISKWEKAVDENAVLTGYIEIEKEGLYHFRTDSDWDRNELIIDGKIVCPFRDGANKGQSVQLRSGLLPIVSVAYTISTTETRVQWMPPGQTEWTDIPNKLFSRARQDAAK